MAILAKQKGPACVTVLKAYFDESFVIPNPLEHNRDPLHPENDGTALVANGNPTLTVGGEIQLAIKFSILVRAESVTGPIGPFIVSQKS